MPIVTLELSVSVDADSPDFASYHILDGLKESSEFHTAVEGLEQALRDVIRSSEEPPSDEDLNPETSYTISVVD